MDVYKTIKEVAEYIKVNNSKEYIIHIPKSDRKIEKKLLTKEELIKIIKRSFTVSIV